MPCHLINLLPTQSPNPSEAVYHEVRRTPQVKKCSQGSVLRFPGTRRLFGLDYRHHRWLSLFFVRDTLQVLSRPACHKASVLGNHQPSLSSSGRNVTSLLASLDVHLRPLSSFNRHHLIKHRKHQPVQIIHWLGCLTFSTSISYVMFVTSLLLLLHPSSCCSRQDSLCAACSRLPCPASGTIFCLGAMRTVKPQVTSVHQNIS